MFLFLFCYLLCFFGVVVYYFNVLLGVKEGGGFVCLYVFGL